MLLVKKLDPNAKLPEVAHRGEDVCWDIFALEDTLLTPGIATKVRTGIAAQFEIRLNNGLLGPVKYGLIIKDRSGMASKNFTTSGGVLDSGYDGEIVVFLTSQFNSTAENVLILAGQKIAQIYPTVVYTAEDIFEVDEFPESQRKDKGFGSSGF